MRDTLQTCLIGLKLFTLSIYTYYYIKPMLSFYTKYHIMEMGLTTIRSKHYSWIIFKSNGLENL
jgi:hypothetical protein